MTVSTNQHPFSVTVVGQSTGETFTGDFITTRILSTRQVLLADRLYREYLGGEQPNHAADFARQKAILLADINSSVVKAPPFWTSSANGLDLLDDNVIEEIWKEVMRIQKEASEASKKKAEEASTRLKAKLEEKKE